MLNGIQNFLQLINDNWTVIAVILGLIIALVEKIKAFLAKTDEEKIEIAKKQIQHTILKMITDAELDFSAWNKAGAIKRSQVIGRIYSKYPILSKVVNQTELIAWIDDQIDKSLEVLKETIK